MIPDYCEMAGNEHIVEAYVRRAEHEMNHLFPSESALVRFFVRERIAPILYDLFNRIIAKDFGPPKDAEFNLEGKP